MSALIPVLAILAAPQQSRPDSARVDTFRLAPVTVSVTRAATTLANVPFAVAVVARDEIARGRVTAGLDEALVTVPGIVVANRYNPSLDHSLSIRGFGARSAFGVRGVKILLDGIPQTLPDGQGQLSNIDLAEVSRIEVLRGPSSALYGNASGGVVSLWTDDRRPERIEVSGRAVTGAYGLLKWQATAATPVRRGSVSLSASETVADGYREHSRADTRRLSLKASYPVTSRTRLTLHGLVADSPWLDDPGALDTTALRSDSTRRLANPRNLTVEAGKDVMQGQAGLALRHQFATGGTLEVAAFGLARDLANQIAAAYIDLERVAYGARAVASLPVALGTVPHVFTVGADAQWQRDDRLNYTADRARLTRDQLERVEEFGPFLQSQLALGGLLTVTLGGRYDRIWFRVNDDLVADGDDSGERIMAALSGSAGATLDLGDALQPYASVASSFESPTTTELANRPTGPGGFNPDLNLQEAVNYEVGVRGHVLGIGEYSLSAFQTDVTDELIPFEVPGEPGRRFFRNAGSARHRGIEAAVSAHPWPSLAVLVAYTLSDFRFREFRTATATFDGNRLPGVPRHFLHGSVRYDAPLGFWIAVDNTYASEVYVDDANTAALRTRPWNVAGGRIGWSGRVGPWRVAPFAGVLNALDERYAGSVVVNAAFGRYYEPAPPRNAYVGLEIRPAR